MCLPMYIILNLNGRRGKFRHNHKADLFFLFRLAVGGAVAIVCQL